MHATQILALLAAASCVSAIPIAQNNSQCQASSNGVTVTCNNGVCTQTSGGKTTPLPGQTQCSTGGAGASSGFGYAGSYAGGAGSYAGLDGADAFAYKKRQDDNKCQCSANGEEITCNNGQCTKSVNGGAPQALQGK
jgi:hypothetical protein